MPNPGTPRAPSGARVKRAQPGGPADPRRYVGRRGEQLAAEHLQRLGFSTLARNVRTRYGEIDLISFDGHTLIFAEVKTLRLCRRTGARPPGRQPLAWLRASQRRRLRRLAAAWLSTGDRPRPSAAAIRFDAIGVTLDPAGALSRIDHVEGAW